MFALPIQISEILRCLKPHWIIVAEKLMDIARLKRVAVIGTSCSGKPTLARSLAQKLKVPHIELDSIHWRPNWTPMPKEEFKSFVSKAVEPEAWVLDGNYSSVRSILWSRATTLIWLNYSFSIVAQRALSRTVRRIIDRQVLYSGNREIFRQSFLSKNSILWWAVKTYWRRRREYPQLFKEPAHQHLQVIVFNSPAETEKFLKNIN